MTSSNDKGILRRAAVRVASQPALVECRQENGNHGGSITIAPLTDDEKIMGFEVRCGCGSSAVVECVYTPEAQTQEADHDAT